MSFSQADARTAKTIDEWLTPPHIIAALGQFDLDPCSPVIRPWSTAEHHFTVHDDGLSREWFGRVWLNPPYGKNGPIWISRLREHGNGIALMANRSNAGWFQDIVVSASAVLFLLGHIRFHRVDGSQPKSGAPAPGVLIAFGEQNRNRLAQSGLPGVLMVPPFQTVKEAGK